MPHGFFTAGKGYDLWGRGAGVFALPLRIAFWEL